MQSSLSCSEARPPDHTTAGFTLVEMAIVIVVLATVLGGIWSALSSDLFSGDYTRELVVNQTGWRTLDRLEEIQGADGSTVRPFVLADSDWITFQKVEGYEEGVRVLGDPITIAFRVAPGETLDGTDENGDGRIDEGLIEYTSGAPAVTVQIAEDILGLRFSPITNGVEYTVHVGVVDRQGNVLSKSFTERVTFRN